MQITEGYFQIPAKIRTPRVSVPHTSEALYVHQMYRYVTAVAEDLYATSVSIILDLPQMNRDTHGV